MSAITATHTPTTTPKRSFRRRYSVARGNAYQAWGVFSGSALLALATQLHSSPGLDRSHDRGIRHRLPQLPRDRPLPRPAAPSACASAATVSAAPTTPPCTRPASAS